MAVPLKATSPAERMDGMDIRRCLIVRNRTRLELCILKSTVPTRIDVVKGEGDKRLWVDESRTIISCLTETTESQNSIRSR
jgi:hypothetical protein